MRVRTRRLGSFRAHRQRGGHLARKPGSTWAPYVAGWAAEAPEVIVGDVGLIDQLAKWFAERLAETGARITSARRRT
jgi:hypothetical protein